MSAISMLAKITNLKPNVFQYAGTKVSLPCLPLYPPTPPSPPSSHPPRSPSPSHRAFSFLWSSHARCSLLQDRRACTVQEVTALRVEPSRLAGINRNLRFGALGDFERVKNGLKYKLPTR